MTTKSGPHYLLEQTLGSRHGSQPGCGSCGLRGGNVYSNFVRAFGALAWSGLAHGRIASSAIWLLGNCGKIRWFCVLTPSL